MSILAYGVNYRTASLDLRERLAIPEEDMQRALNDAAHSIGGLRETAIVSTCNRTELYCAVEPGAEANVRNWLTRYRPVTLDELNDAAYQHWDQEAARHVIRVAAGLDSQMLGEPQIMGQVKTAYDLARANGTLGPELNLFSQITLQTAKVVRTQTNIGRNPVSVASAAVALAQQIFTDLREKHALLLGAGDTINLVAEHLSAQGIGGIAVANRTLANAEALAGRFGGEAMQLTDVAAQLHRFDVVIASTGSSLPVLGKGAVEAAIRQRRRRPIFMVDIAVPRDIEPGAGDLPDVYLYSIDDLTDIIEDNMRGRRSEADGAEDMVVEGAVRFVRERRVQEGQALVTSFREGAKDVQARELARALKELKAGADPERVVSELSQSLTNKLIHAPTVGIREASAEGRLDLLEYLRTLYKIS